MAEGPRSSEPDRSPAGLPAETVAASRSDSPAEADADATPGSGARAGSDGRDLLWPAANAASTSGDERRDAGDGSAPQAAATPAVPSEIGGRALAWPGDAAAGVGVSGDLPGSSGVESPAIRGYRPPRREVSRNALLAGVSAIVVILVALVGLGLYGISSSTPEPEAREDGDKVSLAPLDTAPVAETIQEDGYEVIEREDNSVELRFSSDVLFDYGSSDLTDLAKSTLDGVTGRIGDEAAGSITIEGHTDSDSTAEFNQALSERRADSVRRYLSEAGVASQMATRGFGETRPVAPNDNPDGSPSDEGRARNRRVTIVYDR